MAAKAITTTAYKLARIFSRMGKSRDADTGRGPDSYETTYRERPLHSLRTRAASLGFQLAQRQPVSAEVSSENGSYPY